MLMLIGMAVKNNIVLYLWIVYDAIKIGFNIWLMVAFKKNEDETNLEHVVSSINFVGFMTGKNHHNITLNELIFLICSDRDHRADSGDFVLPCEKAKNGIG